MVVDAHPVVRDGLALLLSGVPTVHLVSAAETGRAALERLPALAPDAARGGLTRREYEVLRLAAQGHTNPEIAHRTGLTRYTVKTYMQSTLQKLGARNRVEAIGKAVLADLL